MKKKVVESRGLWFAYEEEYVLEEITLSLEENDFAALVGPNGGGKTTFVKLLTGLLSPTRGDLSVLGVSPQKAGPRIGYVPQFSGFDMAFPITVLDVTLQGIFHKTLLGPSWKKEHLKKADEIMERLEITSLGRKRFSDLSGGQKQRTLLARALISSPELLILDEPTSSVDITVEEDIYDLLKEVNQKTTILLVTHDMAFVSSYVNKVICLNRRSACHRLDEVADDSEGFPSYGHKVTQIRHQCGL